MMRFLLDSTSEPIAWRKPFVAIELTCAGCGSRLMLVGCDLDAPERLWHARMDDRLRGDAIQFQLDRDDQHAVHKIDITCQGKGCRGNPQVTTHSLRSELSTMTAAGQHAIRERVL